MCEYCEIAEGGRGAFKIFEDDKVLAILSQSPASFGHVLVMPKSHHHIIEQVPDFLLSHLMMVSSKLMVCLFEGLNAEGTNLIISNGIAAGQTEPHFMLSLVPRRENDGINLQWHPKQASPEELSTVELELSEFTRKIGEFEKEKPKPIVMDEEKTSDDMESDDNSVRVRHLTRIP